MLSLTNDGLVGYRRVTGLVGDQLVPDLATALPVPTDGGRTYTFRLRTGIRYSTGALVRPEDFRRAIERVLVINRQGNSSILPFYAGIVGASQCESGPGPCNLARGIVADDAANTVTFHLTAPDPDFLYKLAFCWAYAVPAGTPDHLISAAQLPATGPYMTKSWCRAHLDPGQEPAVPRMVIAGAARRLPGPDRPAARRRTQPGRRRCRARPGRRAFGGARR